ncbi:hypothetical protein [Desulfurobacterium sp.]|uniref:hypothetical protein n=1 Tax=Desulfurobacterium sp. TaxID=2004706 RepID=UPI00263549E2|nr:hypothetical protein [Desulfurobacterium sp.]
MENVNAIEIIKMSWQVTKKKFGIIIKILSIYFLIVFALQMLTAILAKLHLYLAGDVIGFLFVDLLSGGLIYTMIKLVKEGTAEVMDLFIMFEDMNLGANFVIMSVLKIIILAIAFTLLIIPGIYLSVGYIFAQYLLIDRRLSPWEALETSRKTVHKHWFRYFIFVNLIILLNVIGALFFLIGLIVTVPLSIVAFVELYERTFSGKSLLKSSSP